MLERFHHRSVLTLGVLFNVGILLYYKYANFFVAEFNRFALGSRFEVKLLKNPGTSGNSFVPVTRMVKVPAPVEEVLIVLLSRLGSGPGGVPTAVTFTSKLPSMTEDKESVPELLVCSELMVAPPFNDRPT